MKKTFTLFALLILLLSNQYVFAQEPGNSLGKSYFEISKEDPEIMFIEKNDDGLYVYGSGDDGMFCLYYFKNDILVKEGLLVITDNGFAREFYDTMRETCYKRKDYKDLYISENKTVFYYSVFKITLTYNTKNNGEHIGYMEYEKTK